MTDLKTVLKNNIDKSKIDNRPIKIIYNPPKSANNYGRVIELKYMEDNIDDLDLFRSHQDAESADIFQCTIVERTRVKTKNVVDEVRRICRKRDLFNTTDEYALLDWVGGKWGGVNNRWTFTMQIHAFRSGIAFS